MYIIFLVKRGTLLIHQTRMCSNMHEVWKRINLPNIKQGYVISTRGRFKYNSDILSEDKYYQSSNGYKYIILEKIIRY